MTQKEINNIIDNIPVSKVYEGSREMRLIITGSFLLHLHGLMDKHNDVDILVVDAPKSFWSDLFSNYYRWDIRDYGDYKSVKVVFKDVTYNLIEDNQYREIGNSFADLNGEYEYDTLSHALKAKAVLNRPKDKQDFEVISRNFNSMIEP